MSNKTKLVVGGVAAATLLLLITGSLWITLLVLVGVPAVGYLVLDPSQRKRLRRVTRKQLER
ncbi:hypothetical protein SRB5_19380 [Streptomyces sp. RB5]|uniref:Integral membrane protein n=1 Tax=Streptomyces smaragdinus TaxID=2585196 RepID=A0A7K0CEB3_9ACTN|nr:hypothetical protein [Streptomyces smaragdinus]MQY11819.1 hypothetical protein [Streptomyces smaragdinus]